MGDMVVIQSTNDCGREKSGSVSEHSERACPSTSSTHWKRKIDCRQRCFFRRDDSVAGFTAANFCLCYGESFRKCMWPFSADQGPLSATATGRGQVQDFPRYRRGAAAKA